MRVIGARRVGLAAFLLFLATLAMRWPGVAMYDSVSQYGQALGGDYADWHPPIMARAWALLARAWPGTAPFFLIECALWWGGLGLIAGGLARRGRRAAAAATLAIGASPLFLGWATVVLKDAQMAACLIAAAGLAAHWRLAERRVPRRAGAAIVALIAYATLVRGNAVFATVPLALALFGWGGVRPWWGRLALLGAGIVAVVGASGPINHRLLGAEASHVERSLPLYDLAGVAHMAPLATLPGLTPAQWAETERRHCYTPYYWNPYGEPAQCDFVGQALAFTDDVPGDRGRGIMRVWAGTVARHPIAYAMHRLGHLNANLRFWVGAGEPDALPPLDSEPNDMGLGGPSGRTARWLIRGAGLVAASPLGWPVVWLAAALGLLWAEDRGGGGQRAIGRALALSAACMGGSFALVSIASDLRYHLWSMLAAAVAAVLLIDARALRPGRTRIAGGAVLAVVLIGTVARLGLAAPVYVPTPAVVPPPPGTR